jgi:S1-C subfamily serine protease
VEPDDELDDDGSSGPLLPPDDRLWRHPSEMAFAGASRTAGAAAAFVSGRPAPSGLRGGDNRVWTVAILSGVIGALLATGVVYVVGGIRTRKIPVAALEQDVDSSPQVTLASTAGPSRFVTGAEHVRPSCVVIVAHDSRGTRVSEGVVFRSDGMMLATAHMVTGARSLVATVDGSRRVSARVVATDPASDLAVVKLAGSAFTPAPLGSALALRVGDPVIAVRPPDDTASADDVPGDQGSVVGLGQEIVASTGVRMGDLVKIDTTEAASTVGSPVVDDRGAVVAIGASTGSGSQGVVFATPVDLAREIASQLLADGHVVPVWLGVQGTDVDASTAKSLGLDGGAVVRHVYPSSPAAAAGVLGGDIVVGLDGREVTSMANLIMAVHAEPPGSRVELDIERDNDQRTITAVLTPHPAGTS